MHQPHPIDIAAKASGEPVFREVGVGPWVETHPGEPRPDDPQSVNYDRRFDSSLLDEGDRRNVLDQYRYWAVAAIKADLDARGRHDFEVAVENWTHDFNIGSMVRTANAFQAKRVHIVGPHKWNRKGSLMTELYQHVENHPSITELVECWKLRIAGEIAAAQSQAAAIAFRMHESAGKNVEAGNDAGVSDALLAEGRVAGCAPSGISTDASDASGVGNGFEPTCMAQLAAIDQRIAELKAARVIALDIIPGAVPMERTVFRSVASCCLARKARDCPKKRLSWPTMWFTSPSSVRCVPSMPEPRPPFPCTHGSPSTPLPSSNLHLLSSKNPPVTGRIGTIGVLSAG